MGERLYSDEDVELAMEAIANSPKLYGVRSVRSAAEAVLDAFAGRLRPTGVERFQLGDLAATDTKVGGRIEGRVIRIADDGMVTIAVPQGAPVPPMEVTAQADRFAKVEDAVGRLLPADAETETVYGIFRLHDHHEVLIGEHETREEAEEFAAGVREACAKAINAADLPPMRLEIRQRTQITTPWVSSENTEEAPDA